MQLFCFYLIFIFILNISMGMESCIIVVLIYISSVAKMLHIILYAYLTLLYLL